MAMTGRENTKKIRMTRCGGWSIDGGEILLPLQPGLCSRAALGPKGRDQSSMAFVCVVFNLHKKSA